MKAILLAAGFGTRLRPLTLITPKCLVPIKNKPLLEYWLESLTKNDISSILINTHYLSTIVETYVSNSTYSKNCKLIFEEELLGSAGTLISNIDFIENDDCMLIHADNYCLADLNKFIEYHNNRPPNCLITIMTFSTNNPSKCGIIEKDKNGIVVNFHEKVANPPNNIANAAVYILSNEAIVDIKNNYSNSKDFITEILINYLGRIYTYHTESTFIDIGSPETYNEANKVFNYGI
jgi:mannose-1-phosphate guanylyltransferase